LAFLDHPFFIWECKSKSLYFHHQIFLKKTEKKDDYNFYFFEELVPFFKSGPQRYDAILFDAKIF